MQIHLNTYGTYLHIKDQLFEIKVNKEGTTEKHHSTVHKVKSIWIGKGIALSSDGAALNHYSTKTRIEASLRKSERLCI